SPAINAGAPGGCTDYTPGTTPSPTPKPLTTDQRGLPRPYPTGGPCDMGAVEAQPVLSVTDVSMAEGNSGTTSFVFTVSLSPSSAQPVTVHFATADGTAIAGSDYQAASGTLNFSPGDTSKTVTVLVNGDTTFEPDETFFVNLSSAGNAQIAKAQGIGTILNDDPGSLGNISTRLQVGTGNNVLFAGFIIQGSASKTVLIRSAGPSLTAFGVPGAMGNPRLELHDANNTIGTNDNWQITQLGGVITSDQVAAIQNSGAAPSNPAEPAIIATLPAGQYTTIVQGVGNTQGVATVEVYDLSPNNGAILANISTRGFIQTGDNVMIGGFIVVGQSSRVLIRATGPSLIPFGINNALANPQLELHDSNGTLAGNNDWQTTQIGGIITSDQSAAIQNSGLAPGNAAESAIIATLAPGAYTAIAQGVNGGTGVGVIEVFALP
ncbi:MAG TPA: Calx-beta domain-containing protein, partial [Chthoniobacterales bacterium]|nr:Calx-beta domain-containing protein [Chthoniobacterales bacterium]